MYNKNLINVIVSIHITQTHKSHTSTQTYTLSYAAAGVESLSDSLPHGLWTARLLCPWNSPGKNTGVGSHFLLQGIFPTHRLNPRLLLEQADSLPLTHSPVKPHTFIYLLTVSVLLISFSFPYNFLLLMLNYKEWEGII